MILKKTKMELCAFKYRTMKKNSTTMKKIFPIDLLLTKRRKLKHRKNQYLKKKRIMKMILMINLQRKHWKIRIQILILLLRSKNQSKKIKIRGKRRKKGKVKGRKRRNLRERKRRNSKKIIVISMMMVEILRSFTMLIKNNSSNN